jgi:hypothetical protein
MAKRTVYLYRDRSICVVPTAKVERLKAVAEEVFREYKRHKCSRRFDHKIKALAQVMYIWTRPSPGL